jgi:hypothetical protein
MDLRTQENLEIMIKLPCWILYEEEGEEGEVGEGGVGE